LISCRKHKGTQYKTERLMSLCTYYHNEMLFGLACCSIRTQHQCRYCRCIRCSPPPPTPCPAIIASPHHQPFRMFDNSSPSHTIPRFPAKPSRPAIRSYGWWRADRLCTINN
jgi:hypothetical protein